MTTNMEDLVNEAILLADSRNHYDARFFAENERKRAISERNSDAVFIWESALSKMALMDILLPPIRSGPSTKIGRKRLKN